MTPGALLATATFYRDLQLMKKFSSILHYSEEVSEYEGLLSKIKKAFNDTFYNAAQHCYANNSVTSNLLPLAFGLTDKRDEQPVFNNIIFKIKNNFNDHIPTGVIGTQWLMRILTKYGRNDLACTIATDRGYPGWGYMVENGATTTWELWNGNTASPKMNSQNHVMLLGDLLVWLYEDEAGIKSDTSEVAFKKIIMKPQTASSLQFVKATYHCLSGNIVSNWKKSGHDFAWTISIPANTSANVYIPIKGDGKILERGKDVSMSRGVELLRSENNYRIYKIGSGNYNFISVGCID